MWVKYLKEYSGKQKLIQKFKLYKWYVSLTIVKLQAAEHARQTPRKFIILRIHYL